MSNFSDDYDSDYSVPIRANTFATHDYSDDYEEVSSSEGYDMDSPYASTSPPPAAPALGEDVQSTSRCSEPPSNKKQRVDDWGHDIKSYNKKEAHTFWPKEAPGFNLGMPQCSGLSEESKEIEFLNVLWEDRMWDCWVVGTNTYARTVFK